METTEPRYRYAGINVWATRTIADALKAAGLDWQAVSVPITTLDGTIAPDRVAIVRPGLPVESPRRIIGRARPGHEPPDHAEAFAPLQEMIDVEGWHLDYAGQIRDGQIVWIALLADEPETALGDPLYRLLFASLRHDGTPVQVRYGLIREAGGGILPDLANRRLDLLACLGALKSLADLEINAEFADAFIRLMLPDPPPRATGSTVRAENKREKLLEVCAAEPEPCAGTAYGLLQAFVHWVDHYRPVRLLAGRLVAEARMETVMYGAGMRLKRRALASLVSVDTVAAGRRPEPDELSGPLAPLLEMVG